MLHLLMKSMCKVKVLILSAVQLIAEWFSLTIRTPRGIYWVDQKVCAVYFGINDKHKKI